MQIRICGGKAWHLQEGKGAFLWSSSAQMALGAASRGPGCFRIPYLLGLCICPPQRLPATISPCSSQHSAFLATDVFCKVNITDCLAPSCVLHCLNMKQWGYMSTVPRSLAHTQSQYWSLLLLLPPLLLSSYRKVHLRCLCALNKCTATYPR